MICSYHHAICLKTEGNSVQFKKRKPKKQLPCPMKPQFGKQNQLKSKALSWSYLAGGQQIFPQIGHLGSYKHSILYIHILKRLVKENINYHTSLTTFIRMIVTSSYIPLCKNNLKWRLQLDAKNTHLRISNWKKKKRTNISTS